MAHCKYHPLQAATWQCHGCDICYCEQCTGDSDRSGSLLCHLCRKPLDSLGAGGNVEPFWRRLEHAFRYPLNSNAMTVIIVVAVITTLIALLPFGMIIGLVIYLLLTGAMIKYAFRCLEHTADGEMSAPAVGDAFEGGLHLIGQLLLMFLILGGIVALFASFFGTAATGLVITLIMISLPAIFIQFALSENIAEALNPANSLRLVTAIGLPYGLLIGFIMIMSGSVAAISALLGQGSLISVILQSIISNYYTVVTFHIMGYMLFQYQHRLGYTARADDMETQRGEENILAAAIDVHLKEGQYNTVVQLFEEALERFPRNLEFAQNYFEFALNTHRKGMTEEALNHYLPLLIANQQTEKLNTAYTRVHRIWPTIIPDSADARFALAKKFQAKGEAKTAMQLLKGFHKSFAKYPQLADVFVLMANTLDDLNMPEQAAKCRAQAKRLRPQHAEKTQQQAAPAAKPFEARDLSAPPLQAPRATQAKEAPNQEKPDPDAPKDLPPIEFKL